MKRADARIIGHEIDDERRRFVGTLKHDRTFVEAQETIVILHAAFLDSSKTEVSR